MKKLLHVFTGLCLLAGVFAGCEKPEKQSETEDLNIEMVYVEGGEFEMGATVEQKDGWVREDERPVRTVKLNSYYIGKYEVTQAQWKAVMGTSLEEQLALSSYFSMGIVGEGPDYPMYYVSWEEVQEFCRRLSETTGKNYVLPTEAQWEYAARGGNKSRHYEYAGSNDNDEVSWYSNNSCDDNNPDYGTHPVGMKKPNELGIYDMSGNVYEWCSDWYGMYDENDTDNPQGPATGEDRVHRGGTWYNGSNVGRLSCRCQSPSDSRDPGLGFRVVCVSE